MIMTFIRVTMIIVVIWQIRESQDRVKSEMQKQKTERFLDTEIGQLKECVK
jgi:hypothetical protein